MLDKPVCIIPARGGSKRLPRKNITPLAGKTLLAYAVEAALESNIFDRVCVSSEDDEILEAAQQYGASVHRRPPELATDTAQVRHVCLHLLKEFRENGSKYDQFAILLTTNPFRTAEDVRAAYKIFQREDANYVMSLVPYTHPPQRAVWAPNGYVKPYFGLEYMKQTQLLDETYRHDGAVVFGKSDVFLEEKEFYGSKVVPYFIPPERSIDIDTELDLARAEFLLSRRADKHGN
jgi:CMP-N-acetylneuraminic acid synthetase